MITRELIDRLNGMSEAELIEYLELMPCERGERPKCQQKQFGACLAVPGYSQRISDLAICPQEIFMDNNVKRLGCLVCEDALVLSGEILCHAGDKVFPEKLSDLNDCPI